LLPGHHLMGKQVKDIAKFDTEYDSSHEDSAIQTRGLFIQKFPIGALQNLTRDEYVVGHNNASFCNLVESGTKAWANIQGATSFKFGIYFGKTKSDPTRKYRFTKKFGANEKEAFVEVKTALLGLVELAAAKHPDFRAIDANPLSQMFKAKILSLYYPKRFLAVCSWEHLEMLGAMATVAYQTMWKHVSAEMSATGSGSSRRPGFIDSCHAFASDGEVVRRSWPDFYTGPGKIEAPEA